MAAPDFDFQGSIDAAVRSITGFNAKIPFVFKEVLNEVGFDLRRQGVARMDSIFDGGATPFSKMGIELDKATEQNLEVVVKHKPVQAWYLGLQETGGVDVAGARPAGVQNVKRVAIPIAGRAMVDGQGNMLPDFVNQMKTKKDEFFVGVPRGYKQFGLYRRVGDGAPYRRKFATIEPYVIFLKEREYHDSRYEFRKFALERVQSKLAPTFQQRLANEMMRFSGR
jgi:hypothetical protein